MEDRGRPNLDPSSLCARTRCQRCIELSLRLVDLRPIAQCLGKPERRAWLIDMRQLPPEVNLGIAQFGACQDSGNMNPILQGSSELTLLALQHFNYLCQQQIERLVIVSKVVKLQNGVQRPV